MIFFKCSVASWKYFMRIKGWFYIFHLVIYFPVYSCADSSVVQIDDSSDLKKKSQIVNENLCLNQKRANKRDVDRALNYVNF